MIAKKRPGAGVENVENVRTALRNVRTAVEIDIRRAVEDYTIA